MKVKVLTFRVAFNTTVRAREASRASEAGQVSQQPVEEKQAQCWGTCPSQTHCLKASLGAFQGFVHA